MRAIVNITGLMAFALGQIAATAPLLAQTPGDKMAPPQSQPPAPPPTTKPAPPRPPRPVRPRPPRPEIQPPRPPVVVQPPRPVRPPVVIQPPRPVRPPIVVQPPIQGGTWGAIIRCESRNYRYRQCRADVRGGVRLVRVRGGRCIQGQSWGWRGNGIWVDNGCRGDFQVRYYGNGGGYYPPQRPENNGPSTGAIIGGVAVAAGLIALLAASRKNPATAEASAPAPYQPPAGGGAPATISAETGGVTPAARPSLSTCLDEAARQIGATGGTAIRLDRIDEIEAGNGGYRFRFQLQATYPDESRKIPTYCRATPTKLVELTFG